QDTTDELLSDTNPSLGYVGVGLGRVLRLCEPLKIADCPPEKSPATLTSGVAPALADLPAMEREPAGSKAPPIRSAAALAGGHPTWSGWTSPEPSARPPRSWTTTSSG